MKKSFLAAAALAALMAAPATAGSLGTVVTPVVPPPPAPPPGQLSHWVYLPVGVVLVCAIACGSDNDPAPATVTQRTVFGG